MADSGYVGNTIKAIGELYLPGTSQFLDGDVKSGTLHAVAGFTARALFGMPGLLLVAANSFTQSVTRKDVYNYVSDLWTSSTAEAPRPHEATHVRVEEEL